jgi:peptidoglycan/LPS O-acetylase OafA/YrhL
MQWLRKLGRFSLQIYCLHLFFAAGVRIVMVRLGYTEYYGHVLLGFLSAMVGSVLVAAIDEKWFGWWFRFPTRSRPAEKVLSEKAHPMGTA